MLLLTPGPLRCMVRLGQSWPKWNSSRTTTTTSSSSGIPRALELRLRRHLPSTPTPNISAIIAGLGPTMGLLLPSGGMVVKRKTRCELGVDRRQLGSQTPSCDPILILPSSSSPFSSVISARGGRDRVSIVVKKATGPVVIGQEREEIAILGAVGPIPLAGGSPPSPRAVSTANFVS